MGKRVNNMKALQLFDPQCRVSVFVILVFSHNITEFTLIWVGIRYEIANTHIEAREKTLTRILRWAMLQSSD